MICYDTINGRRIKRTCPEARSPVPHELMKDVAAAASERGMLAGDLIAAMTKAIGIPPCGGCEKRREWLNRAHAWLLGRREIQPDSA